MDVMAKKKPRRSRKPAPKALQEVRTGLAEADKRLRAGRLGEAADILEELGRRHPRSESVWHALHDLAGRMRDYPLLARAAEKLLALQPNNPEFAFVLGSARMAAGNTALALETFTRFLERWPAHPRAAEVRVMMEPVRLHVAMMTTRLGLTGPDGAFAAARHEEVRERLAQGEFAEARRAAERILSTHPHFVPALNNLGEAWFHEGNPAEAVATSQRALELDPNNGHALANLIRYLVLAGRAEDAKPYAVRLRALRPEDPSVWAKKAEAFSCLRDDEAVLEALRGAQESGRGASPSEEAFLSHLAAVAAYRLGREDEARELWRDSLRRSPGFQLTEENLADLDEPPEEQHAPWPVPFSHLVPRRVGQDLVAATRGARDRMDNAVMTRLVRRYLDEHPALLPLFPFLFERGDPAGREFAMMIAQIADLPALAPVLRDFALGRWGPDGMRLRALEMARQAGLLESNRVRLWLQGKWHETEQLHYEIHTEALGGYPPEVDYLVRKALDATARGNNVAAERLFRQALEQAPDAPSLLNNLAATLDRQGRRDEAMRITQELYARHPDYLFARTALAGLAITEGQLDRARELLEPVLHRKRLHVGEFSALAMVQVDLLLARGQPDGAQKWIEMWQRIDPQSPVLADRRERVRQAGRR